MRENMKLKHLQLRRPLTTYGYRSEGTRRRFLAPQSSQVQGFQQSAAATTDGSVVFRLVEQPENQHRARYLTEGSRGAIKDRTGIGYPVVQLEGVSKTTRIQIFIGNESGKVTPHMFYQVCKVTGKNSNPCDEKRENGTDIIELLAKPHNDMRVICDCVGILKERFSDIEARFPQQDAVRNTKKISTKCRMVFRTVVENKRGDLETLQIASDVINCTQLPGTPQILKLSSSSSPMEGGGELWMIGKNFLKDAKVLFSLFLKDKEEPIWSEAVVPKQEYFHQSHLIVDIPSFFDPNCCEDIYANVSVKCGDRASDSVAFTYKANTKNILPSSSFENVNQEQLIVDRQYCSVSVIKTNHMACKKPKPTILEPVEYRRKEAFDVGKTPKIQAPNILNEDAIIVPDKNYFTSAHKSSVLFENSFSASKQDASNGEESFQNMIDEENEVEQEDTFEDMIESKDPSSPVVDSLLEDSCSEPTTPNNLITFNTDFSNIFSKKTKFVDHDHKEVGLRAHFHGNEDLLVSNEGSIKEKSRHSSNISVEPTSENKATISISLPASILKDQMHLKNVMETINNTIMKGGDETNEENAEWSNTSQEHLLTRKRNSTGDQISYSPHGSPVDSRKVIELESNQCSETQKCWSHESTSCTQNEGWNAEVQEMLDAALFDCDADEPKDVGIAQDSHTQEEFTFKEGDNNALKWEEVRELDVFKD